MPAHEESSTGVFRLQIFGSHQTNSYPHDELPRTLSHIRCGLQTGLSPTRLALAVFGFVVLDGLTANSGSHQKPMYRFPDEPSQHPESARGTSVTSHPP